MMAQQWPFIMPTVSDNPPLPNGIPAEWQKANEALQAVQSPKSSMSAKSTPSTPEKTVPVANDYNPAFGWQQHPMCYPRYSGFPPAYPHYYYNYNNYVGNNNFYNNPFNQMASQVPPPMPSTPSNTKEANGKAEALKSEKLDALALNQPPPPPPSSSPPEVEVVYYNNIQQAPGSGGLKFNLPKKKPNPQLNNNFQSIRHSMQERMQNFSNGNSLMQKGQNVDMQGRQTTQKSIASSSGEFSPALKNYVARCFDKCKTDVDKDLVEAILRGKLSKAQQEGSVWTKDWDNEPLPTTHSDRLEQEEALKKRLLEKKMPTIMRSPDKKSSPPNSRLFFVDRSRRSRSHSRSYSRSRSRSRTPPPRKVFRRRRRSSSSNSSNDSRGSRRTLSSSVIAPEIRTPRNMNNNFNKNKKNKKKGNKKPFTLESEFCTDERLQKRAARFETKSSKKAYNVGFTINTPFVIDVDGDDMQWMSDAVIGTCQDLEKHYLRLTGAVDPTSVRPEDILTKSLAMVKKHWVEKQDYRYACEQLKSIRQDLVVQCIRNKFTVKVYETHARIALEKGDHTEFNQCQSQLKVLFQEVKEGNRLEFTGYHILYTMYTDNAIELKNLLTDLKPDEKGDEVVSHALKMAKACSSNNYSRFFKLYLSAPKMSAFIVDWFIERIRKAALKAIVKSFRPNIPVSHIQSALAFPSTEDCMAFLTKANLVFVDTGVINCKESVGPLANF